MKYEIILDHGEKKNKCTVLPLDYRDDFTFKRVGRGFSLGRLNSDILLHHQGFCLSEIRQSPESSGKTRSIACIDCVWKRLDPLLARIENPLPVKAKIPEGFVTAYPRKNKQHQDPDGGLATIEAIYIASAFLGNQDQSLLREYYFGNDFLAMNQSRFRDFGITV